MKERMKIILILLMVHYPWVKKFCYLILLFISHNIKLLWDIFLGIISCFLWCIPGDIIFY
jgi:hypothetical protein